MLWQRENALASARLWTPGHPALSLITLPSELYFKLRHVRVSWVYVPYNVGAMSCGHYEDTVRQYIRSTQYVKPITYIHLTFCWLRIIMYHNNVTNLIHFHFHNHFIVSWSSTCFGHQVSIFRRHCTSSFWCELLALVAFGWLQVVGVIPHVATSQKLQVHATNTKSTLVVFGVSFVQLQFLGGCKLWDDSHNLQPAKSYKCTQLTPKLH
jgi:hypothetical protein